MNVKLNLDNLPNYEAYKIMLKLLDDIDDSLSKNLSLENIAQLRLNLTYLQNQFNLRDFYTNYDVDYLSKLN